MIKKRAMLHFPSFKHSDYQLVLVLNTRTGGPLRITRPGGGGGSHTPMISKTTQRKDKQETKLDRSRQALSRVLWVIFLKSGQYHLPHQDTDRSVGTATPHPHCRILASRSGLPHLPHQDTDRSVRTATPLHCRKLTGRPKLSHLSHQDTDSSVGTATLSPPVN